MNIEKRKVKTIDLTPSWRTAVTIYCDVLENPKASPEAHRNAREDLLNLADAMDRVNENKKTIASATKGV